MIPANSQTPIESGCREKSNLDRPPESSARKSEDLLVDLAPELVRGVPLANVLGPFRRCYLFDGFLFKIHSFQTLRVVPGGY